MIVLAAWAANALWAIPCPALFVALSSGGQNVVKIASRSGDVYSRETGERIFRRLLIRRPTQPIIGIITDIIEAVGVPDKNGILVASGHGSIAFWDTDRNEVTHMNVRGMPVMRPTTLLAIPHSDFALSFAGSPTGGRAILWNLTTGEGRNLLENHLRIDAVAVRRSGHVLVSRGTSLEEYDPLSRRGEPLWRYRVARATQGLTSRFSDLLVLTDGRVLCRHIDGSMIIKSLRGLNGEIFLSGHPGRHYAIVQVGPTVVATFPGPLSSRPDGITLWSTIRAESVGQIPDPDNAGVVSVVSVEPDLVMSGHANGKVRVWDFKQWINTRDEPPELASWESPVPGLKVRSLVSLSTSRAAILLEDGEVYLWDWRTP